MKRLKVFRKLKRTNPIAYSLMVGIAIVLFWKGMYGLLEYYVMPWDKPLANFIGVITGLTVLFINDFRLTEIDPTEGAD